MEELKRLFWSKVDIRGPDECWNWTLSVQSCGYGQVGRNISQRYGISTLAHRIAYYLTHGSLPHGLCILHSCHNRKCCNPQHLRAGTAQDNSDDLTNKGRINGELLPQSKLSLQQVLLIRSSIATHRALSRELNVSEKAIRDVRSGRTWKHALK